VTKTGKSASVAVITAPDPVVTPVVLGSLEFMDGLGLKKRAQSI
jgi:hypothetical protein